VAANIEYQLISRIVDLQDFHTVQKHRITEDFFFEALCKQVFIFLRNHYSARETYGSVPSWQIVLRQYPAFQHVHSVDAINTLCEQLRLARMSAQIKSLAESLYQQADTNPREALKTIREYHAVLSSQHESSNDLLMSDAHDVLLQEYDMVASHNGILGIPWPWDILNDETQGLQGGQFIVIYGRPKQMKTWVGLYVAANAYITAKQRVLFVSMEMKSIDIQRRAASVCARLDYNKLRKAQLNPHDRERLFQWLQWLKQGENSVQRQDGHTPMFLATSGEGSRGIGTVQAKIREYQPDLVVVDGLYRMSDDRSKTRTIDWKNITHIAQDLNETAKDLNIPIIGITQANKSAAKNSPKEADVAEIAFADALGQECDMAIRVKKEKDEQTHEPEIILSFPAAREYQVDNIVIHGLPGVNFGYKRQYLTASSGGDASDNEDVKKSNGDNSSGRSIPALSYRPQS
jgi:replicative DNA helicase